MALDRLTIDGEALAQPIAPGARLEVGQHVRRVAAAGDASLPVAAIVAVQECEVALRLAELAALHVRSATGQRLDHQLDLQRRRTRGW